MAFKSPGDSSDEIIADINMTPLIDIMLVLLIIFMVTSSLSGGSGLDIQLPSSKSNSSKTSSNEALTVSLDKVGKLYINGTFVTKTAFIEQLKSALAATSEKTVIFEGDESTSLDKALEIMDMAKDAGARDLALATKFAK